MSEIEEERLEILLRHTDNVKENCEILGKKLLREGKINIGLQLIANGKKHDNSKFYGIEWLYLHQDVKEKNPDLFQAALLQHVKTNKHHPEFWDGGIDDMPSVYLAECICDWKARSNEFGQDLLEWIKDYATDKFKFTTSSRVYKEIKFFLGKLLERKFS